MKTLKIVKTENQRVGYSENDFEKITFTEVQAEYNDAGQIVREERYNSDGELNTLTLNTYNENNQLVEMAQYDQDNVLLQKTINYYDEDGRLEKQGNFYGEGEFEYRTQYVYDEDNNLIRLEMYDDDELDYVEKEMEYSNGLLIEETENDDYGNKLYVNKYTYDEKGQLIKQVRSEIQNKDRRTYEFTYDENGNRIKDLIYDYGNALIAKIYRKFDDQNRQIETEEEDLDNYRKITMEYDGELVSKNSLFDKEGVLQGWAEYTYDENNKENASREFIKDEVNPESFRLLRETLYIREDN